MKRENRKKTMKTGRNNILVILVIAGLLLTGCAAGNSSISLPGGHAVQSYFGKAEVTDVAVRVRQSLNLPLDDSQVPTVTYTKYLPGDCNKKGCPVGMYRSGKIYILEDLDLRYHSMVLAHELIHHYSRVYGLALSETQVIAQTKKAGFSVPMVAMR